MTTDYITPPEIFEPLHRLYHFNVDPCTFVSNPLHLPIFYTTQEDGLTKNWPDNAFVNPPYKNLYRWVAKTREEACRHQTTNVMLLPCGTDTRWFHDYVYNSRLESWRAGVQVIFLRGRIQFLLLNGQRAKNPRTPNMFVIFNGKQIKMLECESV